MIHLDLSQIRAVIFDLNGTLVQDGEMQRLAFREMFQRNHLDVSEEAYKEKVDGHINKHIWPAVLDRPISEAEGSALSREKEAVYTELIPEDGSAATPGAFALVQALREAGIQTALATMAPPSTTSFVLETLGMKGMFDHIVTSADVTRGKPDPEVYIVALDKLGVEPAEVVVFEDSSPGIRASRALGLRTIGVLSDYSSEPFVQYGVTEYIKDFEEISHKKEGK